MHIYIINIQTYGKRILDTLLHIVIKMNCKHKSQECDFPHADPVTSLPVHTEHKTAVRRNLLNIFCLAVIAKWTLMDQ